MDSIVEHNARSIEAVNLLFSGIDKAKNLPYLYMAGACL